MTFDGEKSPLKFKNLKEAKNISGNNEEGLQALILDLGGNALTRKISELGVEEAPIDGNQYIRQDGEWVENIIEVINKTKVEIDTLITTDSLIPSAIYKITGVHPTLYNDGTNSGTTIYLQALTINTLAKEGYGEFWNPKYDQVTPGFKVFKDYSEGDFSSIVGTFFQDENIIGDGGQTGKLVGTPESKLFKVVSGDWSTATSVTGAFSGATANISSIILTTYILGESVYWGGYSWTNLTGLTGSSIDILNLDVNWSKNNYSTLSEYNNVLDIIEYDYLNDWISRRYNITTNNEVIYTYKYAQSVGYSTSAIAVFMFGNSSTASNKGIENNYIYESYFACVNFRGRRIQKNRLIHSDISSNIFDNSSNIDINILNYSTIKDNVVNNLSNISMNILNNSSIGTNVMNRLNINSNELVGSTIALNIGSVTSIINNNTLSESNITENTLISSSIVNDQLKNSNITHMILTSNSGVNDNILNISSLNIGVTFPLVTKTIKFVTMEATTVNFDISSAVIIFGNYPKTIYKRPDGTPKLRYYNNSDILVIASVTD